MTPSLKKSLIHLVCVVAILVIAAVLTPALDNPKMLMSTLTHLTFYDVIIAIMLAVSLNLILGMTGQFSLGHGGFVAVGGYTAAVVAGKPAFFLPQIAFWHLTCHLSMNASFIMVAIAAMIASILVASILGLIVGLPTLRLRGDYLAIATLGFGEIVATLITNSEYLGRTFGFRLDSMRQSWIMDSADATDFYTTHLRDDIHTYLGNTRYALSSFWMLLGLIGVIVIVRNIKYSTTGRALLAIREDLIASEAVGIPTVRYKIAAFVIGAALAGWAGALFAHYSVLNPESFRFMFSTTIVLYVILGGQGSISGSILAATLLTVLPVILQRNTVIDPTLTEKWRMVVYSALIIASMLFMRNGIFGRYEIPDLFRRFFPKNKSKETITIAELPTQSDVRPSAEPLLSAENVVMQFGGLRAVDNFSLKLYAGEIVGLIGPNGAGKTTVFNALTGVYRPTSGQVRVCGKSVNGLKPHAISQCGVARTFQNIRLFPTLSVLDNVQIAQHAHHKQGMPSAIARIPAFYREEADSRANALAYLDLFGLVPFASERATSLSYGDQRRLEIVRALATRPRILLLDEPAAGMNPTEKRTLMESIRNLQARFGLTVLLIEHDMKLVMNVCHRLQVLEYGKTIATGTPDEIRKDPAVIQAYLGASAKHV